MQLPHSLRKAIKIAAVFTGCCLALVVAAALWYVIEFYPRTATSFEVNSPDQPTRILVATQGSEFKNDLVGTVCDRLQDRPVYVKVVDVDALDDLKITEWNRILVINTAMMNFMSSPVRQFLARGEGLDNVLLLITSGGADFKPAGLAVDALSGASRKPDTGRLAELILEWAAADVDGGWKARDQVLALEYFVQVDVKAACDAVFADHDRYRQQYLDLETRLNRVGYDFLARGLSADALHAFRLNRDLFPNSWNVHDSYAEALLASGDRTGAIASYRRSVELNPGSEAGRQRLTELTSVS